MTERSGGQTVAASLLIEVKVFCIVLQCFAAFAGGIAESGMMSYLCTAN